MAAISANRLNWNSWHGGFLLCTKSGEIVKATPHTMNQTDIHTTLLEILQAVIALCEAEKIAYFLIGGGCLGIARHDHGFVPWDDDLDIAVWAGDMPRFLAAAQQ